MKKIIFKYKFALTALFMLALLIPLCITASAEAEDFTVTVKYDESAIYEYNGGLYLSSAASKNAAMKYVIKNNTEEEVRFSAIRVTETLCGLENHYGNTVYDSDIITIAPGGTYELEGDSLEFDLATDFVFQYNIFAVYYTEDEGGNQNSYTESDFVQILENDEFIYITRESISFDVTYDYLMMQDNIYAGDKVAVEFSVTSKSNVPVKSLMVYDTVYGYIGQVDEIAPGETKLVSGEITVNATSYSYAYVTYLSLDSSQTLLRKDFTSVPIEIEVTNHNYFLGMEVKCNDAYIGKGQTVQLEFTVTNVGSGKIENIAVLNEANITLFTIASLESGDIFTQTVDVVCNPNTTYVFRCISPQTEPVETEISFSALPGISLSYKLDKAVDEYKYQDIVVVVYTIKNSGSLDAENLILTDSGIGQTWVIGELAHGEEKPIVYTYAITSSNTYISPVLTGNYKDYSGEEIKEEPDATQITVELPEKYAVIEITVSHSPETIYAGDTVNFSFELKNTGDSALMTYSVLLVEDNMIIASEGKLDAGESKTVNAMRLCTSTGKITVKVEGRNENTGELYSKSFRFDVDVLPKINITPTPSPTDGATPVPTVTQQPISVSNENNFMLVLVLVVGGIALVLVIVTVLVLIKGVFKNMNKRGKKR